MIEKYIDQIINEDCLTFLKRLPDECVDVTFADPPFNLKKKYGKYKDAKEFREYIAWCEQWIKQMVRITKPTGAVFLHNIPRWITYYAHILNGLADFKHWISWEAPTAPMGKTLQPAHYGILFYAKNAKKLKFYELRYPHKRERKSTYLLKDYGGKKKMLHPFGPLISDVWSDIHRIKHNKYRDNHPCQLPIHLMERIILMSSDEGDIILDPFNGTGTTAIASRRLGRKYIGIELDPQYVEITRNKLRREHADSKLGNSWVSFYLNEVVSLRDHDWENLKEHFIIPKNPKDTDHTPIILKSKVNLSVPLSYDTKIQEKKVYQKTLF